MYKVILSLLLCFFTIGVNAQENENYKSLEFAVEVGPEFGPKSFDSVFGDLIDYKVGFVGNFIVTKQLFDNIHLKGGVGYKNKNFEFDFSELVFGNCLDPITGINTLGSGNTQWSLHYIYIPVGFIYKFNNNFNLDFGLDIDILVHENSEIQIDGPIKDPVVLTIGSDNKKVITSLFLGAQIKLNNHIYVKPFINTSIRENDFIGSTALISNFQFTAGLKAGWAF